MQHCRLEPLSQIGVRKGELGDGLLEHFDGLVPAPGECQEPAQLQRDLTLPPGVVLRQPDRLSEVLHRARTMHQPLRRAQLGQHIGPVTGTRRLLQRPAEVRDGALGRALDEGRSRRSAKRGDHRAPTVRRHEQQLCRHPLRRRSGPGEDFGSRAA